MAPKWTKVNNGPEHINEHATYLKEACHQLQTVDRGRHNQVPWHIVHPYLESTIALIGKVLRQPALREILQQAKDAAQCTQNIQNDVTIIKNSVGLSTSPLNSSNFSRAKPAASWAQVAAQAKGSPPNPPPVPQAAASKTHSTVTAYKDRVVTVKLKDQSVAQRHRAHSAIWTKQQVETSISNNAATKSVKVVAAHQLKSGDIHIFTSTTAEATQLKQNKEWISGLGARAELIVPTYGVIVHGIPTSSINIKDQKATIDQMLADNHTVIAGAKISYIGWLTKEGNLKRASSIVVEFTDPAMANAVIYAGMAWDARRKEKKRVEQAKEVRSIYWHVPPKSNATESGTRSTGSDGSRSSDTIASSVLGTHTPEVNVTNVDAEADHDHAETQLSQQIQLLVGTPGVLEPTTFQILVTPPPAETDQLQAAGPESPQDRTPPTEAPLNFHGGEEASEPLPIYPEMGFEEALRHEADDWLTNLADNHEGNWLNTNTEPAEEEPSPLTSTATDTLVASGNIFKGCNCPAHQELYDGWPRLDAELTIARCMKTCVYCGKDWPDACLLRKHIRRVYGSRNITVAFDLGKGSNLTPGWTPMGAPTDVAPRQERRSTRRRQNTDTNPAAVS
ncbi:hypothetical protein ACQRIT_002949 [Beauveria bassiana]